MIEQLEQLELYQELPGQPCEVSRSPSLRRRAAKLAYQSSPTEDAVAPTASADGTQFTARNYSGEDWGVYTEEQKQA
jgi:hypothetical protein